MPPLTESTTSQVGLKGRGLAAEGISSTAAASASGASRTFQERGPPMTVFDCAIALERNEVVSYKLARFGRANHRVIKGSGAAHEGCTGSMTVPCRDCSAIPQK